MSVFHVMSTKFFWNNEHPPLGIRQIFLASSYCLTVGATPTKKRGKVPVLN